MPFLPSECDLHIHTTVSDGTDTPKKILSLVKQRGIKVFSVTDHDAVKGCDLLRSVISRDDPRFITGAEFSCRDELGQYHILGYGYDITSTSILSIVEKAHRIRMTKVVNRLELLKKQFGIAFPKDEIDKLLAMDNPGKPHIGNLMVKYHLSATKEEAIRDFINKVKVKNEVIGPDEAIDAILRSGGIPILAHPSYGNGDQIIMGDEIGIALLPASVFEEQIKQAIDLISGQTAED